MVTKRDKAALDFISKFQVASTSTLKELFYPSLRVAQRRLSTLVEHGEIKREREYINNEYIYFIKKPKQLRHRLLLTKFYKAIYNKIDIVSFENEVIIDNIRPDGLLAYRYKNKGYIAFVEVQISNVPLDLDKYKRLLKTERYKNYFPVFPKLIAITNQNAPQIKDFEIIKINEDMSNAGKLIK
ncbi:hypothetical protein [Natronincola ferrireducens]|uniref:Replication-relaxation n=1 Tax=Natronincola ferrireducens TaxID=393762 RepID=A0A1G9I7V6_9FIRM|nr:hypothetical protein [Natronincola ferrireducens]SDL21308.1 hypothetical protein SAMN05660472_02823 [Natronincola ferrireducens]